MTLGIMTGAIQSGKYVFSQNHNQIPNNHYQQYLYGFVMSDNSILHTSPGLSWKILPNGAIANITYPLTFSLTKVAIPANTPTAISAWFKLDNDVSVGGLLLCKADPLLGIYSDVSAHATSPTTNWQNVSLTLNLTTTGVVEVLAGAYVKGANPYVPVWVDDVTIT